jgi:formylglycine-generating enzyme required for sulfatase activity
MRKKGLLVFTALAVLCSLSACGKNESKKEIKAVSETGKPGINTEEMVFVPAGSFIFGTNSKDTGSRIATPEQKLTLPAFWIDKYEVTSRQFLEFTAKTNYGGGEGLKEGKDWRSASNIDKPLPYPVAGITWNDANAYCKSLGKRLPTEEEWEKAARGPSGNAYPWGKEWMERHSNTKEAGLDNAAPVGKSDDISFYGAHDMFGNVQEWTGSWYTVYKGNPMKDPNAGEKLRVVRGFSQYHKGKQMHLWDRSTAPPYSPLFGFGCRCARDATPEEIAKASQSK